MIAVRYARVSRSDQNPQLQLDETAALIERRGWTLGDTYCDHGVSGTKDRRPELDRLFSDARQRRFDVLLVWRMDRLFRSIRHLVVTLEELSALGIDFISATEPIDTTTPQGRLLFHIVGSFAEFERGLLVERTKAGLAAARRRGSRLGRPRTFVPVEVARSLLSSGKSLRATARELGVGFGTLHRALLRGDPETSPEPGADSHDDHGDSKASST